MQGEELGPPEARTSPRVSVPPGPALTCPCVLRIHVPRLHYAIPVIVHRRALGNRLAGRRHARPAAVARRAADVLRRVRFERGDRRRGAALEPLRRSRAARACADARERGRRVRRRPPTRCAIAAGRAASGSRRASGALARAASRSLLDPEIAGRPTALNVWVAMHELGHVLGLRHREGTCSLMNAQAYDDACAFAGVVRRGPAPVRPRVGRRGGRRAPLRARRGGSPLSLTQRFTG